MLISKTKDAFTADEVPHQNEFGMCNLFLALAANSYNSTRVRRNDAAMKNRRWKQRNISFVKVYQSHSSVKTAFRVIVIYFAIHSTYF